jgi:hypothetical protein
MSDISQLVKKITQASKIQKDRIEQAADLQTAEQESISKMTSPVVEEVAKQAAITQKAIETQHDTLKAIPHHLDNCRKWHIISWKWMRHRLKKLLVQSAKIPRVQAESDSDSEYFNPEDEDPMSYVQDDPWVLHLYQKYRNQKSSTATKMEVDIKDGKLGDTGMVQLDPLINKNELIVTIDGKQRDYSKNLTKGLAALLLLTYKDIENSNIEPTNANIRVYWNIMRQVGYSTTGKKYINFLKDLENKTGKGLFAYKTPRDLESRLELLVGSYYAGNTSLQLRKEIRSILDEMYKIGSIPPHIHKRFFVKFQL